MQGRNNQITFFYFYNEPASEYARLRRENPNAIFFIELVTMDSYLKELGFNACPGENTVIVATACKDSSQVVKHISELSLDQFCTKIVTKTLFYEAENILPRRRFYYFHDEMIGQMREICQVDTNVDHVFIEESTYMKVFQKGGSHIMIGKRKTPLIRVITNGSHFEEIKEYLMNASDDAYAKIVSSNTFTYVPKELREILSIYDY